MSYQIEWFIKDHIIFNWMWGDVTVQEYEQFLQEVLAMAENSHKPLVHVITDISYLKKPIPIAQSAQLALKYSPPDNTGWLITVGTENKIIKFISTVGTQLFGKKIRMRVLDTQEEAFDFLKRVDASIDWDSANGDVLQPLKEML